MTVIVPVTEFTIKKVTVSVLGICGLALTCARYSVRITGYSVGLKRFQIAFVLGVSVMVLLPALMRERASPGSSVRRGQLYYLLPAQLQGYLARRMLTWNPDLVRAAVRSKHVVILQRTR